MNLEEFISDLEQNYISSWTQVFFIGTELESIDTSVQVTHGMSGKDLTTL